MKYSHTKFSELVNSSLIDLIPVGIYLCDSEGYIRKYNTAVTKLWGRAPVIGEEKWTGAWKVMHLDGTEMLREEVTIAQSIKMKTTLKSQELIIERPDGTQSFIIAHPQVFCNDDGKLEGAISVLIDITTQKLTEQAFSEQQLRIALATKSADIGTWDFYPQSGELIWDARSKELFGLPPDTTMSYETFLNGIHPDDRDRTHQVVSQLLNTQSGGFYDIEYRSIAPLDKRVRWLRAMGKAFYDREGNASRFTGTLMDITNIKEKEVTLKSQLEELVKERTNELVEWNHALEQQKTFIEAIINHSVDYICAINTKEEFIVFNHQYEKLVGLKNSDVTEKKIIEIFPKIENTEAHQNFRKALAGNLIHQPVYLSSVNDHYYENFFIPLKSSDNAVYGAMLIAHQITDRIKAEERLLKMNAELSAVNKELEEFAYIASHDLQEPLRKIKTFISVLEHKPLDNEAARGYMNKIKSSADRMSNLIRDVLNYSSLSQPFKDQMVEIDLNEIFENIRTDVELIIEEKNVTIRRDALPVIKGIPHQMNQLFSNLMLNALKFSKENPLIEVRARKLPRHEVENVNELQEATEYIQLRFIDNGIGFDQQYADKIFTIFKRLHTRNTYQGSGIGLAICKRIVENHGGRISATGKENEGATFLITLPAT